MKKSIPLIFIVILIIGAVTLLTHLNLSGDESEESEGIAAKPEQIIYEKMTDIEQATIKDVRLAQSQLKNGNAENRELVERDISTALRYIADNFDKVISSPGKTNEDMYLTYLKHSAYLFGLFDEEFLSEGQTIPDDTKKVCSFFSDIHNQLYRIVEDEIVESGSNYPEQDNEAEQSNIEKELTVVNENRDAYISKLLEILDSFN